MSHVAIELEKNSSYQYNDWL